MTRRIEVSAPGVRIFATIRTTRHDLLARDEVERIRDVLATRLQDAAADLPFLKTMRCNVRVK